MALTDNCWICEVQSSIRLGIGVALAGAGALSAVGSVASGAIGANAATSAAQTQASAAAQGEQLQEQELSNIEGTLSPFISEGTAAQSALAPLIGTAPGTSPLTAPLTAPFQPTMAQLATTPGYQFTLGQGLEATQNSYAGQGLASSGAALKGGVNYAEGLASTTYQQQFQNYLAQNQQIYNILAGQQTVGENAAAQQGSLGAGVTSNITNLLTGGAAATAAGTVGAANATTAALSGVGTAGSNTALAIALNNAGLFGNANSTSPYGTASVDAVAS